MAQFSFSYEVCSCKKVTLGEIVHAIREQDAKELQNFMHEERSKFKYSLDELDQLFKAQIDNQIKTYEIEKQAMKVEFR